MGGKFLVATMKEASHEVLVPVLALVHELVVDIGVETVATDHWTCGLNKEVNSVEVQLNYRSASTGECSCSDSP